MLYNHHKDIWTGETHMPKIALALGSGGTRGIAHIGVLRFLEQNNITVEAVAGSSAGGLAGALIAAGYDSHQIENIVAQAYKTNIFGRDSTDGPSLLGLKGLVSTLKEALGERTFADLRIPFACTAVDSATSQEIVLNEGSVVDAILATVAIPGVFPPRTVRGYLLVDGGIVNPVPVALAHWLAPTLPVLAVCLYPRLEDPILLPQLTLPLNSPIPIPKPFLEQFSKLRLAQAFQIFVQSMDTTARYLADLRMDLEKPDVIIRPDVAKYGALDIVDIQELILKGSKAAEEGYPELRQSFSGLRELTRYFRKPSSPGIVLSSSE
jgi:NTE family protein